MAFNLRESLLLTAAVCPACFDLTSRFAGDVKEFGFREIPDDDNYHSSFSAEVPSAEEEGEKGSETAPKDASKAPSDKIADEEKDKAEQQSSSWFSGTSKKAASWMPWSKNEEAVRFHLTAHCRILCLLTICFCSDLAKQSKFMYIYLRADLVMCRRLFHCCQFQCLARPGQILSSPAS